MRNWRQSWMKRTKRDCGEKAHAHENEGAAAAVCAGVILSSRRDALERRHAAVEQKEKGVYLDPTITALVDMSDPGGRVRQSNPADARQGHARLPTGREMTARAWKMGIKIVAGYGYVLFFDKNNRSMADKIIELSGCGTGTDECDQGGNLRVGGGIGRGQADWPRFAWGTKRILQVIDRSPLENIRAHRGRGDGGQ